MIKINNREYNRRSVRRKNVKVGKTLYEREQTNKEVQQIKKDLVNFAEKKWGKKWIHSILKIGRPFRMQRGINYAKDEKRIENLSINKGQIFGTVQGTAPTPYRVKVKFNIIPEDVWKKITQELGSKSINLINLLEGELPENIIEIFEDNNYSLFPDASYGLNSECSCPDQANPCKHVAAIILYIARVIDYNPFILLKLRGKTKEDILKDLSLVQKTEAELSEKSQKIINYKEFSFDVPKISVKEISEKYSTEDISEVGFQFKKPTKVIDTLENLGNPPNLENPKAFQTVLRAIYRTISSEIYKLSREPKKK